MSQPVDPKASHLPSIEARQGNRLSAVEATTNDNTLRPALARGQETWDVTRIVLSIAIQGYHGIGPTPQRFGKATLQRCPLATMPGEGEYAGPYGRRLLPTTILRGIVYHNDRQVSACGQHHGRNSQCFVMHRDDGYSLIHLHPHRATSLASCSRLIRIAVCTPPGARPCTRT